MKEQKIVALCTFKQNDFGSGEIRTHAPEETVALNQRLRPLGHATLLSTESVAHISDLLSILSNEVKC